MQINTANTLSRLSMDMKLPLTLGLMLFAGIFRAAELPTTLPPHPRLLLAKSDIPQIKQRIATHDWAHARFGSLKSQADGWLGTNFRSRSPPTGALGHGWRATDDVYHRYWRRRAHGRSRAARPCAQQRKGNGARLAHHAGRITLGAPSEGVTLTQEPVKADAGSENETSATAVRIKTGISTHVVVANPAGQKIVVTGQRISARIAHLVVSGDGEFQARHALP